MSPSERLEMLRELIASVPPTPTLDEARAQMESYPQALPDGTTVEEVDTGGIRGEWLRRSDAPVGEALLYLHGGGYCAGSPKSHRRLAAHVGMARGCDVLSLDYRLAPEHRCPSAVDDAVEACRWLRAGGVTQLVIAGDSAGGGLALATLVAMRDAGDPLPVAAVLLAPWVDLALSGSSIERLADVDFLLDAAGLRLSAAAYAGDGALDDPAVSPLFADLRDLPPLLIQVGGGDILLDDATRLAGRAAAAGLDVTLEVAAGMPHVYQNFLGLLPEASEALERIGQWLRR